MLRRHGGQFQVDEMPKVDLDEARGREQERLETLARAFEAFAREQGSDLPTDEALGLLATVVSLNKGALDLRG